MVSVKIVVEGGVFPGDNVDAATFDNSEKFRESFYRMLSRMFKPDLFNLEILAGTGYKQAAKTFLQLNKDRECLLIIDLDGDKTTKEQRLVELGLTRYRHAVFFMVQEMEAWILSQPECISKTFDSILIRKKAGQKIEDDDIFETHPEDIVKPAEKLHTILGRYYATQKNGVLKNKKYGKLKDAPALLANLNIRILAGVFEDVAMLEKQISSGLS